METKPKHKKEIDLTKGQSTSVEGVRDIPTSSEYTSTCSKMKEDQISKRGMPKGSNMVDINNFCKAKCYKY